jgi:hypothetical protein
MKEKIIYIVLLEYTFDGGLTSEIVSASDNFQNAFNSLSKEKNNLLNNKRWQKDLKENNVEFEEGEDYAFYDKMCKDERFRLTIEEKFLNK